MSVSVCLVCLNISAVCLFACISQKQRVQTLRNFPYMLPVAAARSRSDDNAIRYVLPVFWMTSCLPIICTIWCVAKRAYSQSDPPGGRTDSTPRNAHRQVKSCQILHNCARKRILRVFQQVNEVEGRSRSSEITLFDRSYIISC